MIPFYKCRRCNAVFPGDTIHSRVSPADYIQSKGNATTYHKCPSHSVPAADLTGIADLILIQVIQGESATASEFTDTDRFAFWIENANYAPMEHRNDWAFQSGNIVLGRGKDACACIDDAMRNEKRQNKAS